MPLFNQPLGECRIAGQAIADEIAGGDRARQLRRGVAAPRPRKSPRCPPRAGVSAAAHRMYRGPGSRARNCTGNSYCRCRGGAYDYPMKTRIALPVAVFAATLPMILLAACGKQEQVSEVDWAKAALARNPALEIVSTDETAGTFSVRDTTTGAMYQLHTNELMAAPPPSKLASTPATPAPAAAPAAEAAPADDTRGACRSRDRTNYRNRRRRTWCGPAAGRRSGIQHLARPCAGHRARAIRWKARATASRAKPGCPAARAADAQRREHRHVKNAPIPSSARATASCTSTARPWSSRAMR